MNRTDVTLYVDCISLEETACFFFIHSRSVVGGVRFFLK